MRSSLNLVFWGFLFVFLRFEIGIDILSDPIGYFLIALGCFGLREHYPNAQKVGILAVGMILVSIPTAFTNLDEVNSLGWSIYTAVLLFLKLILAYFLFLVLKTIVEDYDHTTLINRTNTVFIIYMISNLLLLANASFSMNVSGGFWIVVGGVLIFATFIMEIVLLILIRSIRKAEPVLVSPIIDA
ncbi:hypothetical protein JSQ81_14295 [Sporosarcina sp. Marseille-Q4063]|uniref:hypothetical protein n=1 Tax=Sporosarcina sp. Marseille-Q4063 TaxID=2810514 RepID=UPI001BAEA210|nr:hypothetical protein [Sporosarcina sp. Marseille-Q4063]QUW20978.1 hypothetical protein JSQ81_14295 [Sporosarcina sp. Marseille-Q4063]